MVDDIGSLQKKYGSFREWLKEVHLLDKEPGARIYRPVKLTGESDSEWKVRVAKNGGTPTRHLRPVIEAEAWFIEVMHAPSLPNPVPIFLDLRTISPIWEKVDQITNPGSDLYEEFGLGAFTWFDLTDDLQQQFERLQKDLIARQAELISTGDIVLPMEFKVRTDKYGEYLRILDGRAAGASVKEIAAHVGDTSDVYPENKGSHKVIDRLRAAENMINFGYLRLLRKKL